MTNKTHAPIVTHAGLTIDKNATLYRVRLARWGGTPGMAHEFVTILAPTFGTALKAARKFAKKVGATVLTFATMSRGQWVGDAYGAEG